MEQIADGMIPAGCYHNRSFYLPMTDYKTTKPDRLLPLFDPQTSGGLLISFSEKDAVSFRQDATDRGIFCSIIGEVTAASEAKLTIV